MTKYGHTACEVNKGDQAHTKKEESPSFFVCEIMIMQKQKRNHKGSFYRSATADLKVNKSQIWRKYDREIAVAAPWNLELRSSRGIRGFYDRLGCAVSLLKFLTS